jgi:hypothetical protein
VSKVFTLRGPGVSAWLPSGTFAPTPKVPCQSGCSGGEFIAKLNIVRHDDIAGLQIANHQAVLSLSQMERHQQAYTRIEAVLVALVRRSLQVRCRRSTERFPLIHGR